MQYGLTEKGFVKPTFDVLLEEEKELFWRSFGRDIDLSPDGPEGEYVVNRALKEYQIWEMVEGLWLVGDPASASGPYLDRLASFVNVKRIEEQPTRVYAALWGKEGTSILAGHLAKTDNAVQFYLDSGVTLNRDRLLGFYFKLVSVGAGEYLFSIDGRQVSYTATLDDSETDIQEGLFQALDATFPGVYTYVNRDDGGLLIHSKGGQVPFAFYCGDDKIKILSLGAFNTYLAKIPGPTFVPIGYLNTIETTVKGLEYIINYATGIMGRYAESDTELRIEMQTRQKRASGNEVAIKNAIKEDVPGVKYVEVYSNRSMAVVEGMPAKSFEAVVVGGDDNLIASTIFDKGPGGIEAHGTTKLTVHDSEGNPWPIGFTRPMNLYVWLMIGYERNTKEDFPNNGQQLLIEKIEMWGAEKLGVGVDLIFQRLDHPIYEVPGIKFAFRGIALTTDPNPEHPPLDEDYIETNITVGKRQIAVIDRSRIIVREMGV